MHSNKKANTIIFNHMNSNIIDEAIVVLKPGVKIKQSELVYKNKNVISNDKNQNILLMETQKVINDYISEIENKQKQRSVKKLKKRYIASQIFNVVLIISMAITIEVLL